MTKPHKRNIKDQLMQCFRCHHTFRVLLFPSQLRMEPCPACGWVSGGLVEPGANRMSNRRKRKGRA